MNVKLLRSSPLARCRTVAASLVIAAVWGALVATASAELRLSPLFGDGMVLQRETRAPIWGWATPGAAIDVTAEWGRQKVSGRAVTDAAGAWRTELATPAAGGPYSITIAGDGGSVALRDVLIGEVWLCSGQSNMEWPLAQTDGAEEAIAAANLPRLRLFNVPNATATRPSRTFRAQPSGWRVSSPQSAAGFSAVAQHFARTLLRDSDVPIGLIQADWGGTRIEAWMPAEVLATFPDAAADLEMVQSLDPDPAIREERTAALRDSWWSRLDLLPGAPGADWMKESFDDRDWGTMELPQSFGEKSNPELTSFDGIICLRRSVELGPAMVAGPAFLELGPIDDRDEAFVNGVLVGGTREDGQWARTRRYAIPAGTLRVGTNVIAIRVLDTAGTGGVNGAATDLAIVSADGTTRAPLAGAWRWIRGAAAASLPSTEGPEIGPNSATVLYNAMIAPLVPMALEGVIWYQGESNRGNAEAYARLFPAMIRAWRERFGEGIAFHFVQIAPFRYGSDRGETAALREAQAAALDRPNTGMVVTLDVGNAGDIHPRNKKTVGERLAALVLGDRRGDRSVHSPRFTEAVSADGEVRVHFDQQDVELKAGPAGLPAGLGEFTIAGSNRVFVAAEARIEGATVVIRAPEVKEPVAARYAWSASPEATLFTATGLPVAPFRTDGWRDGGEVLPGSIQSGAERDPGHTEHRLADPDLVPLFNGRDLSGWVNINTAPSTWTVAGSGTDALIHCTGLPTGLLRTDRMYENFVLELEWRHLREQGNAGLFVWSDALTAIGQPFTRAVEVQVMVGSEGDWYTSDGDIFPIHGAVMTPENGRTGSRAFPTEKRMKPSPEWNHYVVTCQNGEVSLAVNGKVVTRGREASPRKGYICLESEGTPIDFRNIRIKELPPATPALAPDQIARAAEGWRPLYTGVDLANWKIEPGHAGHWKPSGWVLSYDGGSSDLWSEKSYGNFELIADWRLPRAPIDVERPVIESTGLERKGPDGKTVMELVKDAGDSGIYLRGSSRNQVNIWSWPCGSGEVYGYRTDHAMSEAVRAAVTPTSRADKPPGEWNRFHITMRGDRLTVVLNGVTVIENAELPGIAAEGPIALQHHGDPIEFANIMIRELE